MENRINNKQDPLPTVEITPLSQEILSSSHKGKKENVLLLKQELMLLRFQTLAKKGPETKRSCVH